MEVDQLFETMTIKEIKQQNIKTRTEIEKKKEELRFLVSERYRDIIDAADTIFEMKTCAADINESLKNISNIYKNWNGLIVKPYESNSILIDIDAEKNHKRLSLVAQIKLILNMSELIWNALETKKFSKASMLFNICRNMSIYSQIMRDKYHDEELDIQLIFNRHWSSLSNMETTIGLTCRNFLKSVNFIHASDEVLDSLLGIILLEDQNMNVILSEYLSCVDNQIMQWFSSEKSCLPINQQLNSVAEIIMRAISNVYQLFMNNVLIDRLNELSLINVRDMECTQERIYQHLPNEISSFKPVQNSNNQNIDPENVLKITNAWLKSCRDKYSSFFVATFKHLSTVKSIGEIRIQLEKIFDNNLIELNKSAEWSNLENENSDEWKSIIKAMYSAKLKEIIDENISLFFIEWTKGIERFMTSNVTLLNEEEFDGDSFFNYFWTEFNKDVFFHSDFPVPSYVTDNQSFMCKIVFETLYHHFLNFFDVGSSISNRSCSFESLVVKYKVVRPEIYQITRLFNNQLLKLINEVICTINDNEDFLWVILKNCLMSIVDRCVDWSKNLTLSMSQDSNLSEVLNHENVFCFVNNRTNKMVTVDQLKIIIVSQSMRTIYELLPSFQAGLMTAVFNSENLKSPIMDNKVVPKRKLKTSRLPFLPGKRINHQQDLEIIMWKVWNDVIEPIKQTINELLVKGTQSSISNFIKNYFQFVKLGLSSAVASDEICTKWMAINLANQDLNNDISVPLEVPIQCSWPMHILLFNISHLLSIFGAHSISGKCNDVIRLQILNMIIDHFQVIMKSEEFQENKFIQKQNVQLIFDIRFLLEIINAKTGIDKVIQDSLRDLLREIEKNVDPFDYEMMSEILHQNLSQNVAKNSSIYWLLSSNQPKRNLSFGQKLDIGTAHNLIDLVGSGSGKSSKSNLRFGMLPVSGYTMIDKNSTSNSSKIPATPENKPINLPLQTTSSKSNRPVSNFSLNSSKSYFARMGTNWF